MTPNVNVERMVQQLLLHEGEKLQAYLDTEDNWTFFVGYNLDARGVEFLEEVCKRKFPGRYQDLTGTRDESRKVLRADILRIDMIVPMHFPEYLQLSEVRRRVVLDMAFNMGFRALGFKNTIGAVKRQDWSTAARELYKSKWSRQVGDGPGGRYDRCERLSNMLLTGTDYTK